MSEETAVAEFSVETTEMGDKIADLTLKQAKELSDYLKEAHGIVSLLVVAVMAAAGLPTQVLLKKKTEFDVVLTGFGDKKLNVVKVVKNLTALADGSQEMVEGVPATLKEGVAKEEADKIKGEIEEVGGAVELK